MCKKSHHKSITDRIASVYSFKKHNSEAAAANMATLIVKSADNPQNNGSPVQHNGRACDETDLAATRRLIPSQEMAKNRKVHWLWDAFALGSILTFLADIGSDLVVAALYYQKGEYEWFGVTLGFVVFSSIALQIFSAKWFRDDRDTKWGMYVLHFLHIGPILRYWNVFRTGWRTRRSTASSSEYHSFLSQWRDICMLRLLEAYLESAPQLVLQLYILSYRRRFDMNSDLITAIAAACSLVSLAWAIVAYQKSLRDVFCDNVSWTGFFLQVMWRLFMVASRVVAMVLFASYFNLWLGVAIALHWLLMFIFLVTQSTKFCMDNDGRDHPLREMLFDGTIAFIYIFSFFNITEGMTRIRVGIFYSLMFIENSVFVLLWYPHRSLFGDVAIAAITIVIGGFFLGLLSMFMYYHFYHPNIQEQGMCFKRKTGFNAVGNYSFSNIWCCCCELRAIRHRETNRLSTACVCHKPKCDCLRTQPAPEPMLMDMDMMPRSQSILSLPPQLVNPGQAAYLRREGRHEVIPDPIPMHALSPTPSDWV